MRQELLIVRALPQEEGTTGEPWGGGTGQLRKPPLILPHPLLESHSQQLFDAWPASPSLPPLRGLKRCQTWC